MSRKVVEGEPMPVNIPSLRIALEHWRTSFYDESLLEARAKLLNGAQIPSGFLGYAYGFSRDFGGRVAILEHEATISAAAKQEILKREITVIKNQTCSDEIPSALKTVTLAFRHQHSHMNVLIAGPVDVHITKEVKKAITDLLGLPARVMKRSEINPKDIDPRLLVNLPEGIIGPFVSRGSVVLSGIFYLKHQQNRLVAIAATPWETLIIEQSVFSISVDNWHNRNTQHVPLKGINLVA